MMLKHFNKWIELVALLQNSLKFATMAFFNHVVSCFKASIEDLGNQEKKSFETSKTSCIKALIDHFTTSKNHF